MTKAKIKETAVTPKLNVIEVQSKPIPVFMMLEVSSISTGKNIRKDFDKDDMSVLVESIRQNGIIEPLIAVTESSSTYTLIAGERRLKAARQLKISSVPCRVYSAVSESDLLEIMMSENLLRSDLNPIEEAQGFKQLLDLGVTQEDLGTKLGRSQEFISNRLRLLSAPVILQKMIVSKEITPTHVNYLLAYSQYSFFDDFLAEYKKLNQKHIKENGQNIPVSNLADKSILPNIFDSKNLKKAGLVKIWNIPYECRKECEKCKKRSDDDYSAYCLDVSCSSAKITAAAEKQAEEDKKKAEERLSSEEENKLKEAQEKQFKEQLETFAIRSIDEIKKYVLQTDEKDLLPIFTSYVFSRVRYSLIGYGDDDNLFKILYGESYDQDEITYEKLFRASIFSSLLDSTYSNYIYCAKRSSNFVPKLFKENNIELSEELRSAYSALSEAQ